MRKHTFHHDGFTHTCRVYPWKNVDIRPMHFGARVPWKTFPDVEEELPGMPVLEFKVRCQRKHHKIIIWPNGKITLSAHSGRAGVQSAKVAEALGQNIRCFEVMNEWRRAIRGYADSRTALPKAMRPVLDECLDLKADRYHHKRRIHYSKRKLTLPLKERLAGMRVTIRQRLLKQMRREDAIEGLTHEYNDAFKSYLSSDYAPNLTLGVGSDVWCKRMILAGLCFSPLRFEGENYLPWKVPDRTVENGSGICMAIDAQYRVAWLVIERVSKRRWKVVEVYSRER